MTNAGMCGGDEQTAHVESFAIPALIAQRSRLSIEEAPPRRHNRSGLVGPLTDHTARGGTCEIRRSIGWRNRESASVIAANELNTG